jgi:hypothetical protein
VVKPSTQPAHDEVAVLAYHLWERRGRPIGSPEVDWFRAESDLSLLARGGRTPEFREYVDAWAEDLEALRQNWLLSESGFPSFARDRGLSVFVGEPEEFCAKGWLTNDGTDHDGGPRFHPFRIYPLHQILQSRKTWSFRSGGQEGAADLARLTSFAQNWNRTTDLAILLEPVYWPQIVGHRSFRLSQRDHEERLKGYREKTQQLIRGLDPNFWRKMHESLRIDAACLDKNNELYVLLRVAGWVKRKNLQGQISGALWIRHIAEVIRRAFEEVHSEQWLEEDQAFRHWFAGARTKVFGSDRPFDDTLRAKPYVAYNFELFTGSKIRWYVEGTTEYYAATEAIPDAERFGIEIYNLEGSIQSGRDNTALKLEAMLREDRAHRRFSIISLDGDLEANRKAICRQVRQDNIVGSIFMHSPDFEFANFAIEELTAIIADGDSAVRTSDELKKKISRLKGKEWGRKLAAYAREHPRRSDNGEVRLFLKEVRVAFHGWNSDYDFQRDHFTFDCETFEEIRRVRPTTVPTQGL